MNKKIIIAFLVVYIIFIAGCSKKEEPGKTYEIIDGKIVLVDSGSSGTHDAVQLPDNYVPSNGSNPFGSEIPATDFFDNSQEEVTAAEAGNADSSSVNEGVSYLPGTESSDGYGLVDALIIKLETAADACREIYRTADKGDAANVTLSMSDVASMITAIGNAGYAAQDSTGKLNMQNYSALNTFGEMLSLSKDDIRETYFIVYPDGHISGFMLSRESQVWHLYSASMAWNDDLGIRVYSQGRYAVGRVKYTDKGWLIYSRDSSDFDENMQANTDSYVMIRVLPYDSEKRVLCEKYVEPVGYLENNLFTTNWSEANMGPIDFNSLYAYLFGMYNGTQMLSSYNVRNYYKAVQGTRLYLVPTDTFENTVTTYFNIDRAALKNISDYNAQLGGYFFLGYDRDYYNVAPKTPSPEVVSYTYNSNGSITMVVDAVNRWYGTDRAFRHELTVMPGSGASFRYMSNTLIEDESNIIPQKKLAEMLDVELTKTTFG